MAFMYFKEHTSNKNRRAEAPPPKREDGPQAGAPFNRSTCRGERGTNGTERTRTKTPLHNGAVNGSWQTLRNTNCYRPKTRHKTNAEPLTAFAHPSGIRFTIGNPTDTPSDLQDAPNLKKTPPPTWVTGFFCYRRGGRSLLTRELFKTHGFASDSLYHNTPKAEALFSLFGRLERLGTLTKYTSIPELYNTT